MNKISPCLWFDDEAEEAAKFYVSIFPNSKIKNVEKYVVDTPSNKPIGSVMTVVFEIDGFEFMGLNGGDYFKKNPSISFFIGCKTKEEVDEFYKKLHKAGKVMMELGEYPFSKRYAWIEDRFGVSWQLFLGESKQKIVPSLMFTGKNNGKAEEAMKLYTSIFENSKIEEIHRYEEGNDRGKISHARFSLLGGDFIMMESGLEHKFNFNEGISLMIPCEDQEEIDYYYDSLSAVPESEVCGWLKDKYGLSWQIVPTTLGEMMKGKNAEKVMSTLLKMKKIDIEGLRKAHESH